MKAPTIAMFLLLIAPVSGLAYGKKKLKVPVAFQTARTVHVECMDGDITSPNVSPADHQAILQMEAELQQWGRYRLVDSQHDADLVIVVRKGHAVGDSDHLGLGPQPKAPEPAPVMGRPNTLPVAGGDIHDGSAAMGGDDIAEQDLLRVYTVNEKGKLKGPIWSSQIDGGLNGPSPRLFQEMRTAVEIVYPAQTAQQPTP